MACTFLDTSDQGKIFYLELHGRQLVEDVAHAVPDNGPCDFILALSGGFNSVPRHVVECDNVPQHTHSLVERAESIVRRVAADKTSVKYSVSIVH